MGAVRRGAAHKGQARRRRWALLAPPRADGAVDDVEERPSAELEHAEQEAVAAERPRVDPAEHDHRQRQRATNELRGDREAEPREHGGGDLVVHAVAREADVVQHLLLRRAAGRPPRRAQHRPLDAADRAAQHRAPQRRREADAEHAAARRAQEGEAARRRRRGVVHPYPG